MKRSQMLDMLYNEIVGYDPTGSPKVLTEKLLELIEANGMLPPLAKINVGRQILGKDITWIVEENTWEQE